MSLEQQLWHAAAAGDMEAVQAALTQGAPVDARDTYGDTALNRAAEGGHLAVVTHLLAAGADLENLGGAAKTPLMNAAFAGQTRVVQFLLDQGARVNTDLLASLQLKVNILFENAEAGQVNPAAAEAWQRFLDHLVRVWEAQNPAPGDAP